MEEISIVRKRSRVWAAALWFMGDQTRATINLNDVFELGRRSLSGTT